MPPSLLYESRVANFCEGLFAQQYCRSWQSIFCVDTKGLPIHQLPVAYRDEGRPGFSGGAWRAGAGIRTASGTRRGRRAGGKPCRLHRRLRSHAHEQSEISPGETRRAEDEPKLKPWVNALRVRNTYDYRPLQGESRPTRVESVMFYNAISQCINSDAGWAELGSDLVASSSDFARIALAGRYSVGLGHLLLENSLPLELAEIASVRSLATGDDWADKKELIKFLNQIPEGCFLTGTNRVRIIGPGQWALFLQRHFCQALRQNFRFLHSLWGVPDEARNFASKADEEFGKLRCASIAAMIPLSRPRKSSGHCSRILPA